MFKDFSLLSYLLLGLPLSILLFLYEVLICYPHLYVERPSEGQIVTEGMPGEPKGSHREEKRAHIRPQEDRAQKQESEPNEKRKSVGG